MRIMAYTKNPYLPRVRRDAADLVRRGWGVRKVSRYIGVSPGTITKWVRKAKIYGFHAIPTLSSKPRHHPRQLKTEVIRKIVGIRLAHGRTSEVVHQELLNQGIRVSLNSVRRTIDRAGLMKKRSPWKRYHPHQGRPYPLKPGDLVELDTIHFMVSETKRIYVFVLLDVHSRWAYAKAYEKMNSALMLEFVREAQRQVGFHFNMLQSDHGPEFGKWFVERIKKSHRYTRIGKPNDNSHIERFNRTLQEECLDRIVTEVSTINCELEKYLRYYNTQRLHMGISLRSPMQLLTKCFQAIG